MTAKEYADKDYRHLPTYHKIAVDAFNAGKKSAKPSDVIKLENKLKDVQKELKHLWETLENPEACGELLSGM